MKCHIGRILALLAVSSTSLLAHPGHYHPDETDEFDFLTSSLLHSHGAMDFILGGVALASLGVAFFRKGKAARLAAATLALGAITFLSIS
jgi:hypothetical protein